MAFCDGGGVVVVTLPYPLLFDEPVFEVDRDGLVTVVVGVGAGAGGWPPGIRSSCPACTPSALANWLASIIEFASPPYFDAKEAIEYGIVDQLIDKL